MADSKTYAQVVIEQLGSQIDLGTTLATALIGGMVALLTQIALHNTSRNERPLILRARGLILAIFVVDLLSLVAGYVGRGTVTGVTPILMQLPPSAWTQNGEPLNFTNVVFDHAAILATSMKFQAGLLFVGVLLICWFAWVNRRLI